MAVLASLGQKALRANKAILITIIFYQFQFAQTTVHTKHVQYYDVKDFADINICCGKQTLPLKGILRKPKKMHVCGTIQKSL